MILWVCSFCLMHAFAGTFHFFAFWFSSLLWVFGTVVRLWAVGCWLFALMYIISFIIFYFILWKVLHFSSQFGLMRECACIVDYFLFYFFLFSFDDWNDTHFKSHHAFHEWMWNQWSYACVMPVFHIPAYSHLGTDNVLKLTSKL